MNRIQLATLLSWAGDSGVQGRKRLQKVVYFLQHAGCPLDCQYTLHHYGPYSRDVADVCDEMVAAGLVEETCVTERENQCVQYSYKLKPEIRQLLDRTPQKEMPRFQTLGTRLINEQMGSLELGSTVLFFYRETSDWERALENACEFKRVRPQDQLTQTALLLAKEVNSEMNNI